MYVPKGGVISVELWRNLNDHKAWYVLSVLVADRCQRWPLHDLV